jgi:hypothetical protein
MKQAYKETPEYKVALKKRIHDIIYDSRLDNYGATDIVFAIFNMGREGLKLEDITVEAVQKAVDSLGY